MKKTLFHFITRSLRNNLFLSLALVHLLTIGSVIWYFYASYDALMETIKDDQLEQLADAYATNNQIPHLPLNDMKNITQKERFIVQIWDKNGELITSSLPTLKIPLQKIVGLHTLRTDQGSDEQWRVYTRKGEANSQIGSVQLIHNISYMRVLIVRRALSAIIPLIMLFPLSFGVLWLIVWRVSRNLKNASILIASQESYYLPELPQTSVPEEILPIVEAYNSVLRRLRKAFDTQSHFLQDSAHELRTPITAISLQLENLRQYIPSGEALERFNQLEAGVLRIRNLVGQLLALTRQEGTEFKTTSVEIINIGQLIKESIEQLMVLADSRGIDIGFTGTSETTIEANRLELRSLFDNLISNAMRHTPPGSVVDVVLKTEQYCPVVEIIDNGPGIAEENIHRAFDRFSRFNAAETHGSGLGLAIVKSVATRHGLKVELNNRYNGKQIIGLCVKVTFASSQSIDID